MICSSVPTRSIGDSDAVDAIREKLLDIVHIRDQGFCLGLKESAGLRQRNRAPAAVKKLYAEFLFKLGNLLAKSGLCHEKRFRRPSEIPVFSNSDKV